MKSKNPRGAPPKNRNAVTHGCHTGAMGQIKLEVRKQIRAFTELLNQLERSVSKEEKIT